MTRPASVASILTIALAVTITSAVPAADLTIVSKVTAGKGEPMTTTQYLSSDKVRTSDGKFDTIMDAGTGRMIHIDHKKKTYYETSLAEMRAQFAELEKTFQDAPMLGKMLRRGAVEAQLEKGSGSRTIAGYPCSQYFLTVGKKTRMEMWATTNLKTPIEYYDARKMAYSAIGPAASRFDKLFEAMKKINGFPLYTALDSKMMGMNIKSVSEATEVRKGPIPAAVFEPPTGYKKKKSPYENKGE